MRPNLGALILTFLIASTAMSATASRADGIVSAIPAGTVLRFRLGAPVSSDRSRTGDSFSFVLLEPIRVGGREIVAAGTVGTGTVFLAGHAGNQGHEGDLTLRLDGIRANDGRSVAFSDQRFEMNGRNRKIASNALGFVPYVGFAAMFIRGAEKRVGPDQPIETVLLHSADVTSVILEPLVPSSAASAVPAA